ncbi:hypothetical protein [Micromonospora sp. LOL_021]
MPVGGFFDGFLVQAVGERTALWVCAVGMLASLLPRLGRPVLRLPRDAGIDQRRPSPVGAGRSGVFRCAFPARV